MAPQLSTGDRGQGNPRPRARERDDGWLGGLREYVPDAGPVASRSLGLATAPASL
jgi:hypothetical protein